MSASRTHGWKECLFLTVTVCFFFGCIATTQRSVRTLRPGQVSFGVNYLSAEDTEESDADAVKLLGVDARVGVTRGFDIGLAHTWDMTKDNENLFATAWLDGKLQLTNRDNQPGLPIITTGLMKGWVYDKDVDLHITSVPIMLGIPVSRGVTPFIMYRAEWIDDTFIPSEEALARGTIAGGVEVALVPQSYRSFTPKLGASIGWMNSLSGGEGDDLMIYNVGFSLDGPAPNRVWPN